MKQLEEERGMKTRCQECGDVAVMTETPSGQVSWVCEHCGSSGVDGAETRTEMLVRCVIKVREIADLLLAKIEYLAAQVKDESQVVEEVDETEKGGAA